MAPSNCTTSEAEKVAQRRVQVKRTMGLAAMQEHGDADDRDVGQPERNQDQLPPRQIEHPCKQHRAHGNHRSCTDPETRSLLRQAGLRLSQVNESSLESRRVHDAKPWWERFLAEYQ